MSGNKRRGDVETRHWPRLVVSTPKPFVPPAVTSGITIAMLTGARAPVAKVGRGGAS